MKGGRKSRAAGGGESAWPAEEECLLLLERAGCSEGVVAHARATARIAVALAERMNARRDSSPAGAPRARGVAPALDIGLVRAGALLHDLGRGRTTGIGHVTEGARIARELGLPEEIVRIIQRHPGAGITAGEAVRMGLPAKDHVPLTLEEKVVAHADNLAGRRGKDPLRKVLADLRRKGVPHLIPRMEALHRELSELCGEDIDLLES